MAEQITSLGYLSGKAHFLIKTRVQHYLDTAGIELKMEYYPILNTLWQEDGLTQQCLSDKLGYDRHKMSRLLDVLEANGWIQRKDHPNSRREKMVTLTSHSHSQREAVLQCIKNAQADALQGFSPERKQLLVKDLQEVIHNLT